MAKKRNGLPTSHIQKLWMMTRMRQIDRAQINIMEAMRGCNLQPDEAMSVMLSIALSIARETELEPVKAVTDRLEEIQFWQDGDFP